MTEPAKTPFARTAPNPSPSPSASGSRRSRVALWLLGGLLVVAVGAALQAMASVAIPVVFALLITLVVAPLHAWLTEQLPDPLRGVAHVAVMALLLAIIAAFLGALTFAADRVLESVPEGTGEMQSWLPGQDGASGLPEPVLNIWNRLSGSIGSWLVQEATALARGIAQMTGVFITTLVLVFFLVLLALTERTLWHDKITSLWPRDGQTAWAEALEAITARLRRFLVVRTAVGLVQAALYVGWLALFGVDLLFVWGVLTFVLSYIPNLGSVISGTLPVFYALVTKDFGTALGVAAGLLTIEQIIGNFVDPRLMGRQIVLSPLVILISLLFWTWLWGIAGAFLATPITLSLVVILNHVEALRPIALTFSNRRSPEDLDAALGQGAARSVKD